MSNKLALMISVRHTLVPGFSNQATSGVDSMANNLQYALRNSYANVRMVQMQVKKKRVEASLMEAAQDLRPGGFCLIYYHGHGTTLSHLGIPDNDFDEMDGSDEALVCYDGYLTDDELDVLFRRFHRSTRIMTIMDCCSSETLVEWRNFDPRIHPQIIHIAAARDDQDAAATINGGVLSRQIESMVDNWGYSNYTFASFLIELNRRMVKENQPIHIRKTPTVGIGYLRRKLFT